MKIQCHVCHKVEASVFCPADEAALCHGCDRTIHHANKLAGKHTRFSLHQPNPKDSSICDICQERRAYIFCREDRAILCRECDLPIHGANEHTQKHNRFLLTGVKLGSSSPSSSSASDPTSLSSEDRATSSEVRTSRSNANNNYMPSDRGSVSTSSISEYLIETIPGYCIEDLLDASFPPNGFCKVCFSAPELRSSLCTDYDLQVSMCSFPLEAWSPQSQVRSPELSTSNNLPQIDDSSSVEVKEMPRANTAEGYSNWGYNGYTVPSISPSLIKKCRRSR